MYTLPWILITTFGLLKGCDYLIDKFDYSLSSQKFSPDRKNTIFEFYSNNDNREGERVHASYGTLLSLSHKEFIQNPKSGYIFFAGYCQQPLSYSWLNNNKINVVCRPTSKDHIRTQATIVDGITIEINTN